MLLLRFWFCVGLLGGSLEFFLLVCGFVDVFGFCWYFLFGGCGVGLCSSYLFPLLSWVLVDCLFGGFLFVGCCCGGCSLVVFQRFRVVFVVHGVA